MTATSHAILGTIIAAKIGNPLLAIPIAFTSHIAADLIPHWDTGTNEQMKRRKRVFIESFFDVIAGFVISFLMIQFFFPKTDMFYAFLIIIVSQSLDWMTAPYYFFHIKQLKFVYDFQKKFDNGMDKPWGIINQIAVLIIVFLLAKLV